MIIDILEIYYNADLNQFDKPFLFKQFITIADSLKKYSLNNDIIEKWRDREHKGRYYNLHKD